MYQIVFSAFFLLACAVFPLGATAQNWPSFVTDAREAILVDYETGTVLFEKNADELMPPASMSKLMTAVLVLERLKNGTLNMEDSFRVSERAWRKGGSKMFVEVGKRVAVSDLLRGIIVQSGNDACIVIAEGLAGSEEAFAEMMTVKAREMGLTRSTFANATGWPDPNHRMTARELAALARYIIAEFPEYYSIYSEREFTFSGIRQGNRNPLLYRSVGADGLKTGHTQEAGYGLTASAIQGNRRLILVVNGLPSMQARADESERILDWGFRNFENYAVANVGDVIADLPVWQGVQATVPVATEEDIILTLPKTKNNKPTIKVVYESPIQAPVAKGTQLARLKVKGAEGAIVAEIGLVAAQPVEQLGMFGRIKSVINFLLLGTN